MAEAGSLKDLAVGFYSTREVQQLAGVPATLTRRFLSNYKSLRGLWGGISFEGQHLQQRWYATFKDMMELRYIKAFRDAGVSWQQILNTSEHGRTRFDSVYPFSHRRFRTEGKEIYASTEDGLEQFSRSGQYAFDEIIGPELFDPMEYDDTDSPVRWYPAQEWGWKNRQRMVVVDPLRAFGSPVIADFGIPTRVLYDSYLAESKDIEKVSRIYEVPLNSVSIAVDFEKYLVRRGSDSV